MVVLVVLVVVAVLCSVAHVDGVAVVGLYHRHGAASDLVLRN